MSIKSSPRTATIHNSNLSALKSIRGTLSSSLGPYGLDKMIIQSDSNNVLVTNDGCTILSELIKNGNYDNEGSNTHPLNNIILSLTNHQDKIAGDGTTSVIIILASLVEKANELISGGVSSAIIVRELNSLKEMINNWIKRNRVPLIEDGKGPLNLKEKTHYEAFYSAVKTSLSSKILNSVIDTVVPLAIDTIKYKKIRHFKLIGNDIEHSKLVDGVVLQITERFHFDEKMKRDYDSFIEDTSLERRIGILQYPLSAPKPNIDSKIQISENIDKIIKEEKEYIFNKIKEIKKAGLDFVLIQKNILRETVSDLADYFMKRLGISYAVVEREEIDFLAESFSETKDFSLSVEGLLHTMVMDVRICDEMVRVVDLNNQQSVGTLIVTGTDNVIIDECSRSFHDANCVVKSLYENPFIVGGGGACEINLIQEFLLKKEVTEGNEISEIKKRLVKALEVIPFYLCKNAGLNYYKVVDDDISSPEIPEKILSVPENKNDLIHNLSKLNLKSYKSVNGINLTTGKIENMVNHSVVVPSHVVGSYLNLAFETAAFVVSIDDILPGRG